MKSFLSLKDNIYDLYDSDEQGFFLFEPEQRIDYMQNISAETPLEERSYLKIFFRAESKRNVYTREGYDLLTFLGDLGGLADIVVLIGSSLTALFSSTMI